MPLHAVTQGPSFTQVTINRVQPHAAGSSDYSQECLTAGSDLDVTLLLLLRCWKKVLKHLELARRPAMTWTRAAPQP